MPRKPKSVETAKNQRTYEREKPQPTLTDDQIGAEEKEPQPTLTDELPDTNSTGPKDRDKEGKFTKGNSGGPGNPHARSCARMLEMFRNAITAEELFLLVRK